MHRRRLTLALFVGVVLCGCSRSTSAQPPVRKSQLGTVTQQVATTTIELTYRRPVARGRALFGSLVPWGKVWTPSADSAARISISTPITINGSTLSAGTYSMWAIPDSTSWTIIFSRQAVAFHLSYPQGMDMLRIQATPQQVGDHAESMLFAFPMVDADSATLHLQWGKTVVPMSIKSKPDSSL